MHLHEGSAPTLTQELAARGLSHQPTADAGLGQHGIFRGRELVFVGTAHETWGWLAEGDLVAAGETLEVDVPHTPPRGALR